MKKHCSKWLYAIVLIFLATSIGTDCAPKRGRKLVVVGLDGRTFDLIKHWVKEGSLPHFERLMKEGMSGDPESSIPALSPTAWTTAATGVHPG